MGLSRISILVLSIAVLLSSVEVTLGARNLLQVAIPTIPPVPSNPTVQNPVSIIPTLPKAPTTLPPLPSGPIPTLPQPALPLPTSLPKTTLPPLPSVTVPKVTLPPLPASFPTVPSIPFSTPPPSN